LKKESNGNHVCPLEWAGRLDNRIRRVLQNPQKILAPYIAENNKVLDIGCGPGYFSMEIAKMVGAKGQVFAVDMQEGMLQLLAAKVKGSTLESRIQLIKSSQDGFTIPEKVDFILAFYMVHEVPDKKSFFNSARQALADNGSFLIVEPAIFHVSKKEFAVTLEAARESGFLVTQGPRRIFSQTAILKLH
jgi:ubiquinone/menaquinone biosynthesis C-methylase UbiE